MSTWCGSRGFVGRQALNRLVGVRMTRQAAQKVKFTVPRHHRRHCLIHIRSVYSRLTGAKHEIHRPCGPLRHFGRKEPGIMYATDGNLHAQCTLSDTLLREFSIAISITDCDILLELLLLCFFRHHDQRFGWRQSDVDANGVAKPSSVTVLQIPFAR